MPEEQKGKLRLEISHVLFIDIVGYSKLLISEQSELLEQLKEMVRKSPEAQTADSEGKLIRLATGEVRVRAAFEAARAQQEKIVQAQPDYGPALCVLAMIDAALGHKDLALDEGRRAIALMPVEKDVFNGSRVLQYFAITVAWAGEKEIALKQLETGLHAPNASSVLSYGALKLLPFWDPLRGDPRFERIVASLAPKDAVTSPQ